MPMLHHPIQLYSEGLLTELKHAISFGIYNPEGRISISETEEFLADALEFHKDLRRQIVKYRYAAGAKSPDGKGKGQLQLSCGKRLAAVCWVEAIADAYSCAQSIRKMVEGPEIRTRARERGDLALENVFDMIEKPGGELLALFTLIKQGRG